MHGVLIINEKIFLLQTTPFTWMQKLKGVGCLIFFGRFSRNH